jgi:shikimate kinase
MGFKHVGKSVIGQVLAQRLNLPYYELDAAIESLYQQRTGQVATCRQIVADNGEAFFRNLETEALQYTLGRVAGVVALGGGAVMADTNRSLIRAHIPVHITAPKDTVRKRVTAAAWPQAAHFEEIWQERDPVYRQLAKITIENTTIENAVNSLVPLIKSNEV